MTLVSNFSEKMKKIDPEYSKYCEETLEITREDFNIKMAKMLDIDPNSHFIEIFEAGSFINKLWHYLRGDE